MKSRFARCECRLRMCMLFQVQPRRHIIRATFSDSQGLVTQMCTVSTNCFGLGHAWTMVSPEDTRIALRGAPPVSL